MNEEWRGKGYSFFQNKQCEYFPCHKTSRPEDFSCLFCYCPLYALGEKCGGAFSYTEDGVKDCSKCLFPHRRDSFGAVNDRFRDVAALARRKD
ncbi:MAG: metal-binding protein [Oscillospiraceae bacterium]|nr:metal-binding protein [Oscillospiraceae bacterium]